jgi:exodeoxyribonuclease III
VVSSDRVKIATWNVNSVRTRLPRLRAWLERRQPDVLCLQETKVEDEHFPLAEVEALGYRAVVCGERTYNGVAILSRQPGASVLRALPGDGPDAQRRLLVATIGGARIVNIYAPNGGELGSPRYTYKLDWYRRLLLFLEGAFGPGEDVVLCGDFNIAPEDRDVWAPELWRGRVMATEAERACFRALLGGGLADALRIVRPEAEGVYTWWDYREGAFRRNRGLRIDHVLLSPSLAKRCAAVEIDRDERRGARPSDHAPVVATLE